MGFSGLQLRRQITTKNHSAAGAHEITQPRLPLGLSGGQHFVHGGHSGGLGDGAVLPQDAYERSHVSELRRSSTSTAARCRRTASAAADASAAAGRVSASAVAGPASAIASAADVTSAVLRAAASDVAV